MTYNKLFAFLFLAALLALAEGMVLKRSYKDCLNDYFNSFRDKKPRNADAAICFSGKSYHITFTDKNSYQSQGSFDCFETKAWIKHKNHYDCWYFLGTNTVQYNSDTGDENLAQWYDKGRCIYNEGTLSCYNDAGHKG
ncbi:uncharacterized protein SPSC_01239 [Sporisorium scitamineum]|uniref:DUF7888 domain-containing protein n=1 Tax=Sporisorium scitamineum TaxID=49012 RepID=A0A127Z901_9BASI|nr:uncharacterized protein SPSC_01239 [Sporisorium scitamineum]